MPIPGRRRVLAILAAGAALAGVALLRAAFRAARAPAPEIAGPDGPLSACIDAVIPAGHGLPGALEVGAPRYVRRALGEARFAGVRRVLEEGALRLDAEAQAIGGLRLVEMTAGERVDLLAGLASRDPSWARFREALLDFTLEGYLSHPARGGNAGGRAWIALAVPMPAPFVEER